MPFVPRSMVGCGYTEVEKEARKVEEKARRKAVGRKSCPRFRISVPSPFLDWGLRSADSSCTQFVKAYLDILESRVFRDKGCRGPVRRSSLAHKKSSLGSNKHAASNKDF